MNNKKTLIIVRNKNKYFWRWAVDSSLYDVRELYAKECNIPFINQIKKKQRKLQYVYLGILGGWKYDLVKYDKIIFLDSSYSRQTDKVVKRFQKKYHGKVIFFFWNKLHLDDNEARKQISAIYKNIEVWSYNKYDCKKFNLKYNSTMYIPNPYEIEEVSYEKAERDIFFGGWSTNERLVYLNSFFEKIQRYGITYFVDTSIVGKITFKPNMFVVNDKCLDYSSYLDEIKKSRVILNIDKYPNMGCSLRAIEALQYKKKYITNNIEICKETFYDDENIFILGKDNLDELKDFIKKPYKVIDNKVLEYYYIPQWIKRFD